MSKFVIVHGAWHTGELFEAAAAPIRDAGHAVYLPTAAGNALGDSKNTGLGQAISSIVDFIETEQIEDFVLVGHSFGGMLITGVADQMSQKIRRLVYWNAFVPHDGESLNDMVPPHYIELFRNAEAEDGSVTLPFQIWRDAFINDASLALAEEAYAKLNPHPYKTFTDTIALKTDPADMQIPKSFINCTEDIALPGSYGWHPRLSEKLGLFRLVQCPGSHELCFSNPALLSEQIMLAGRD